jgi:hypothetical protein
MATHINLKDIAVERTRKNLPDISWKNVRDALTKCLHKESFHPNGFIYQLERPHVLYLVEKEIYLVSDPSHFEYLLYKIKRNYGHYFPIENSKLKIDLYDLEQQLLNLVKTRAVSLRKMSKKALKVARSEGFVGKVRRSENWELTELGESLLEQKALKPISKARAQVLLNKTLTLAEEFNGLEGPTWKVSQIYLFGSMLKNVEKVNDVDLMIKLVRPTEILGDSLAKDRVRANHLWPGSNHQFPDLQKEAYKYLRSSPCISLATDSLQEKLDEAKQSYRLIWEAKNRGSH